MFTYTFGWLNQYRGKNTEPIYAVQPINMGDGKIFRIIQHRNGKLAGCERAAGKLSEYEAGVAEV